MIDTLPFSIQNTITYSDGYESFKSKDKVPTYELQINLSGMKTPHPKWYLNLKKDLENWKNNNDGFKPDPEQIKYFLSIIDKIRSSIIQTPNSNIFVDMSADSELCIVRKTNNISYTISIETNVSSVVLSKSSLIDKKDYFAKKLGKDYLKDESAMLNLFVSNT